MRRGPRWRAPSLARSLTRGEHHRHDRPVAASIHTLGTSAATIGQIKWGGTSIEDSRYLTVCSAQFPNHLGWPENQIPTVKDGFRPGLLSIQDIAPGRHLGKIMNGRIEIDPQLEKFSEIDKLLSRIDQRQSFNNNPVLRWEPGVIGNAEDGVTAVYKSS